MNIIGPKAGYSPEIGTLVSMLTWMRMVVLMSVKDMAQKDLDHLVLEEAAAGSKAGQRVELQDILAELARQGGHGGRPYVVLATSRRVLSLRFR